MDEYISIAIKRLQEAAIWAEEMFHTPLVVCYSGGKDSQALLHLAHMANIPFSVRHNVTTADAPETMNTVKRTAQWCSDRGIEMDINYPDTTMWKLIVEKCYPPTRLARYCCEHLKERNAHNTFIATGVRKAESTKRKGRATFDAVAKNPNHRAHFSDEVMLSNDNDEKRRLIEQCIPKATMCVNPIIDWTNAQIATFYWGICDIHNPLYAEGFSRVGCIGCPMGGTKHRQHEFARWPKYKAAYLRAFQKMLENRERKGLSTQWQTADEVFHWWIQDGWDKDQMALDLIWVVDE